MKHIISRIIDGEQVNIELSPHEVVSIGDMYISAKRTDMIKEYFEQMTEYTDEEIPSERYINLMAQKLKFGVEVYVDLIDEINKEASLEYIKAHKIEPVVSQCKEEPSEELER